MPNESQAPTHQLTVDVRVDDLGVVHFGGITIGPSIIEAAGGVLRRRRKRERQPADTEENTP
jgi:hypothetical protein